MLGCEQWNQAVECLLAFCHREDSWHFDLIGGLKVMRKYLNAPAQLRANHSSTAASRRSRQLSQITVVTLCCLPLWGDRAFPTQSVIPCSKVWSKLTAWKKINKDFRFLLCNEKLHCTFSSLAVFISYTVSDIPASCNLAQCTKTSTLRFHSPNNWNLLK